MLPYRHLRRPDNAGQRQNPHFCRARPASGRGQRLRRWRRWSHIVHQQDVAPATRCRLRNLESAQHIARGAPWPMAWRPGWGWDGCAPARRYPAPGRCGGPAPAPAPPPGYSAAATAGCDAAAPARSGRWPRSSSRPARSSHSAKPGTRSSRSACLSARMGARLTSS